MQLTLADILAVDYEGLPEDEIKFRSMADAEDILDNYNLGILLPMIKELCDVKLKEARQASYPEDKLALI